MVDVVVDGITVKEKNLFLPSFTAFENDHETVAVEALFEVAVNPVTPVAEGAPGWAIGKILSGPMPTLFCAAT